MTTITGTFRGATLVSKSFGGGGTSTRDLTEVWLYMADFAAYTGASDDAALATVGANISAQARDGRTRTLLWAGPAVAGSDANNQAVMFGGGSVAALTISSDSLTGDLNAINAVSTEVTATSGTTKGVGTMVCVYVT